MASKEIIIAFVGILVCVMIIGLGEFTPNWITGAYGSSEVFNAGLTRICIAKLCVSIVGILMLFPQFLFVGGSQIIGGILALVAALMAFAGLTCGASNMKSRVRSIGGVLLAAGICFLGGVIWYGTIINDLVELLDVLPWLNNVMGIKLGYSFYLCLAGSIISLILAVVLLVLASNMPTPPTYTGMQTPAAPTTVTVTNTSHQMSLMPTHPSVQANQPVYPGLAQFQPMSPDVPFSQPSFNSIKQTPPGVAMHQPPGAMSLPQHPADMVLPPPYVESDKEKLLQSGKNGEDDFP